MTLKLCWYGGYSYAFVPDVLDTVESPEEAAELCRDRYFNRGGQTPAVEYEHNGLAGYLYADDTITDSTDLYPDFVIRVKHRTDKAANHLGCDFRPEPA
jgi:hypothetical protein